MPTTSSRHAGARLGARLAGAALALALCVTSATAGPWRAGDHNTSGWAYMTPKERLEHQATVRAFTDLDACRAYQRQHHAAMEARARAAGQPLRPGHRDICAHLRPPPPGTSAPASTPAAARP